MTYLVLARKWRPRSFDTLVGQDHVVRALTHALDTQRLHHAWLFTGTRGVGKTTLSRILAKSLNCEQGITAQPCGQCRACTEIDAGRYVDYVELDAASNRGVDEMTQLLEQAVYAPSSARFKVYMIDEVHMLTGHAFNAMLKTLEEPPAHVKFILATTDPQKIPVTVLSRCLQFNLKHMTVDAIVAHLTSVLGEEALAFEAPALRLLGQAAGGSMRDALSLTDQAIAYSAGNLTLEAVQGMLGTIDQRHLVRLLQAISAGQASGALAVADELAARGLSYAGALADLSVLLSRIAIQQRVPGGLPEDDPLAADVASLAAAMHPDLVQLYYSVAVHSRSELALAPDEYAGFIMACLRMLSLTPASAHLPEPPSTGGRGEASASGPAMPAGPLEPAVPPAPAAPPPASAEKAVAGSVAAIEPAAAVKDPVVKDPVVKDPVVKDPVASPEPPGEPDAGATPAGASASASPETGGPGTASAGIAAVEDGPDVPAWEALPDEPSAAVQPAQETATALDSSAESVAPGDGGVSGFHETAAFADDATPPVSHDSGPAPLEDEHVPVNGPDAAEEASSSMADDFPSDFPDSVPAEDFDHDAADFADASGWEPVIGGVDFNAAQLAPLPREAPEAVARPPRLARMTAQDWPALAASLPLTGLAAELARQSEWVGVDDGCITLRVAIHSLAARQGQARLRTVLTEHFGKVVQLVIEFGATGSGTAHAVEQVRRAERQQEAEVAVANDPFVRSLIEEFGARVMPGSIAALDGEKVA